MIKTKCVKITQLMFHRQVSLVIDSFCRLNFLFNFDLKTIIFHYFLKQKLQTICSTFTISFSKNDIGLKL